MATCPRCGGCGEVSERRVSAKEQLFQALESGPKTLFWLEKHLPYKTIDALTAVLHKYKQDGVLEVIRTQPERATNKLWGLKRSSTKST